MAGSLESVLASIPGYAGYRARGQQKQQEEAGQLAQAQSLQGLLASMQQQEDATKLRATLAASGGDVEAALTGALKSGNVKAAHDLAPLAKLAQERRASQETTEGLQALNAGYPQGGAQPEQVGGPPDQNVAPANPQDARQQRIAYLTKLGSMPKYANNPIVQQRLQAEIDKLGSVKPMVEHNFSIGGDQVQPHISYDEGRNWQPIPGSKPSAKFAKKVEAVNGPDNAAQPTADTLEMDAWRYLTDGTLPTNMGRGAQGSAQATAIRNRSSALAKEMGMSPDEIRMSQLTNKTAVQAIGQLAKAKAQILQFEKTASMNADLALEASEKVDRTGIPVFNRWLQAGRTAIAGDVEAQKFTAANETFVSEYAKVMGGGYGAAASTEGAQARAHQLLNTANTKEQYRGVVSQLKREMDNRVKALNGQMEEEKGNLRKGIVRTPPAAPATAPAAAAPAPTGGPKSGDKSQSKSGKAMTFDGKQWVYD